MNVTLPWSRRVCTQPASVTVDPTSASRSSPSVLVRSIQLVSRVREVRCFAGGAGLHVAWIRRRRPQRRLRVRLHVAADLGEDGGEPRPSLLLVFEVAHDDVSAASILATADDGHFRAVLDRALELLVERPIRVVDRHGEAFLTKTGRKLQT